MLDHISSCAAKSILDVILTGKHQFFIESNLAHTFSNTEFVKEKASNPEAIIGSGEGHRFTIKALSKATPLTFCDGIITDIYGEVLSVRWREKDEEARCWEAFRARVFCGAYPEGLIWADRYQYIGGNDYQRLAFMSYRTLQVEFDEDCPEALKASILWDAATVQTKKGKFFQTSTVGQGVILGETLDVKII